MGALRKAGVWLGLVEDEDDDRCYDDGVRRGRYDETTTGTRPRARGDRIARPASRYADEFADEDDELDDAPARRARGRRAAGRASARRRAASRATGRTATPSGVERRSAPASGRSPGRARPSRASSATRPGTTSRSRRRSQLRERAVVADEDQRVPDHDAAPDHLQRGAHDRRALPRRRPGDHEPHRDGRGGCQRLVDFAAGLAFGLRGTIERVTNRVFLLSPANVQVTAEDKAKIAEGGFFNQS